MRLFALGLSLTVVAVLGLFAPTARAADSSNALTARLQVLLDAQPDLSVKWKGRAVSALPFRLRLQNQASPLAYSLDIRRQAEYGDAWTAISLGRPSEPADRSLSQIGVANPLPAEVIARGGAASGHQPSSPTTALEFAARQVAIWATTNGLPLTPAAVPSRPLLTRAQSLYELGRQAIKVPLQAAYHDVQIFVRETTANEVLLAVSLNIDPNTSLSSAQEVDLYLDGLRYQTRTGSRTRIKRKGDGTYTAQPPSPLPASQAVNNIAEVELDRNTKVVDASAVWVGVLSEPGLVMVSDGKAPPVITGESVALNFGTTARLDPSNYTNPSQLLNQAGTAILAGLPNWAIWPLLLLALYLLPRIGRWIDALARLLVRLIRREPQASTVAEAVVVEAPTASEALRVGLAALGAGAPSQVDITVLQAGRSGGLVKRARPAKLRVAARR